jgi:sarcosine oxidase subunit gamma
MADGITANRTLPSAGFQEDSIPVSIKAAAPASRISLRAKADAVARLSAVLGISLTTTPKTSVSVGLRTGLWLGPDEWLVIDQSEGELVNLCASAGVLHAATDVSHRNTAYMVAGRGAEAVLNTGCPQDLSLEAFPVGACSRTVFGKAEVVILRVTEDTFRVECWRSFSEYVGGLLEEGARDVAA